MSEKSRKTTVRGNRSGGSGVDCSFETVPELMISDLIIFWVRGTICL